MPTLLDDLKEMDAVKSTKKDKTLLDDLQEMEPVKVAVPVLNRPPTVNDIPGVPPQPQKKEKPWYESVGGRLAAPWETTGAMLTGMIATPIGALAGLGKAAINPGAYGIPQGALDAAKTAEVVSDFLTYKPKTEAGQDMTSTIGNLMDASKIGGMGPTEAVMLAAAKPPALRTPPVNPQAELGRQLKTAPAAIQLEQQFQARQTAPQATATATAVERPVNAGGTVPQGAAPVAPISSVESVPLLPNAEQTAAMLQKASPELKATLESAAVKGGVNADAAKRQLQGDTLRVPVRMTQGQALQDAALISDEMNRRAKIPGMVERLNEQNKALVDNFDATRQAYAPTLSDMSVVDNGRTLIRSYEAQDAARTADISTKYKALADANGGEFPIDLGTFFKDTDAALKKDFKKRFVPPEIQGTLDDIAERGAMNFEEYENLRTILATAARNERDGNKKAAIGIIRENLENLPIAGEAAELKPLADAARSAAKARFDLIKRDPAYKAVVDGRANAEDFVTRYIAGAREKDIPAMLETLGATQEGKEAIASGVVNHLKSKASIGVDNTGNFASKTYRNELARISHKIDAFGFPEMNGELNQLGSVSHYVTSQPKGSYVNNSNTLVGAIREGAVTAAEQGANVAAKGLPVGTAARTLFKARAAKKESEQKLKPGAGTSLGDFPK